MKNWEKHHGNFRFISGFGGRVIFIIDRAAVEVKSTPNTQKLRSWKKNRIC